MKIRFALAAAFCGFVAAAASGQVTPAAGYTPPDDTPSSKIGVTIFSDFTHQQSADFSSFNVSRAYNGENYNKAEVNGEKGFMLRASVRPLPLGGVWKGLRVTGFVDADHYAAGLKRQRQVGQVTFEHPLVNAGAEFLKAKDQSAEAKGYSLWATPRFGASGFELLLRHDELKPNSATDQKRKRNIAGLAYWMPNLNKVTAALMLDYDSLQQSGFTPVRPDTTSYGVKMLINF